MALDDVSGLDIVREDDDLLAHGATGALHQGPPPLTVVSAQPERDPRSGGTVNGVTWLGPGRHLQGQAALRAGNRFAPHRLAPRSRHAIAEASDPEEALQLPPVEADHDLPIHHDDRGGHLPGEPDHLLPRGRVLRDINAGVRDPLGRKKLFGCVAGCSGRGRVDRHGRVGHGSSFLWVPHPDLACSSGRGSLLRLPIQGMQVSVIGCMTPLRIIPFDLTEVP